MNQQEILLNILTEAIGIEIYGREYYSIFSELVEEEKAKAIFRGLARDEGEHRELLEKEYKKISGKPIDISEMDEENREKARRIFPESLEPMGIGETKDVLTLGIRTEKRSIELYSMSAQKTDVQSSKDLFLKLAHFEEGHKETLQDALYYLEQEGSWYGYSPPTIEG
ncbi:MAG: ferritin family protein [Candidatus Methanoperedens sp.]|nr:ferritin family protein [Candidatus Methanoperedens sp.]MCZ7395820.1 ferritin family protein [Candidatus Methanoperedens sp.]